MSELLSSQTPEKTKLLPISKSVKKKKRFSRSRSKGVSKEEEDEDERSIKKYIKILSQFSEKKQEITLCSEPHLHSKERESVIRLYTQFLKLRKVWSEFKETESSNVWKKKYFSAIKLMNPLQKKVKENERIIASLKYKKKKKSSSNEMDEIDEELGLSEDALIHDENKEFKKKYRSMERKISKLEAEKKELSGELEMVKVEYLKTIENMQKTIIDLETKIGKKNFSTEPSEGSNPGVGSGSGMGEKKGSFTQVNIKYQQQNKIEYNTYKGNKNVNGVDAFTQTTDKNFRSKEIRFKKKIKKLQKKISMLLRKNSSKEILVRGNSRTDMLVRGNSSREMIGNEGNARKRKRKSKKKKKKRSRQNRSVGRSREMVNSFEGEEERRDDELELDEDIRSRYSREEVVNTSSTRLPSINMKF